MEYFTVKGEDMARSDVENFLKAYASNGGIQADYKADRKAAVSKHAVGTTADEQALLVRGDAHEIKVYLKDSYGASLSVNIP